MSSVIHTNVVGSISELKKNPMALVNSGHGEAVAVLNHNQPVFYCVPAEAYEALMNRLDDFELGQLVEERQHEKSVPVSIDDL